jgi:two-component system OmpR family response regulator
MGVNDFADSARLPGAPGPHDGRRGEIEEAREPDIDTMLRTELAGRSVLLLEDEMIFAMPIAEELYRCGVDQVNHVQRGDVAAREGSARHYDVLLLDRNNPGMDGLEALQHIRCSGTGSHNSPALIITGKMNSVSQRSLGLLTGADDYVDKGLELLEIMARIVNCLARARAQASASLEGTGLSAATLRNGPITVNARERLAYFNGEPIKLETQSYDMLQAFCASPGKPFTKSMAFELSSPHWKNKPLPIGFENALHKAINRLRKALQSYDEQLPEAMRPMLVTLRGQGYMLRDLSAVGAG